MQVGMHVSIAGSIDRAIDNAVTLGCTAFQIYTRNPRGWMAKPLAEKDVENFKKKLGASKIDRFATVVEMPFLPNLASPEKAAFTKSLDALLKETKRCAQLGIPYFKTRLGAHMGAGIEKGIENAVRALKKASEEVSGDVMILLENSWGGEISIGHDFEQLASALSQLDSSRFGICLDTCHAFVAGYDLRNEQAVKSTLAKFDKIIGLKHLKIIHLNDSKQDLGSNIDRHEHIGLGKIGEAGLGVIIKFANSKKIPMILETPIDDRRDDLRNIQKVKDLA